MIKLSDIEKRLENVDKKVNEIENKINETNLATNVINKLIKVILFLIVFIFLNNIAWIVYISLPVETEEIIQDADTEGEYSPINQEIGE